MPTGSTPASGVWTVSSQNMENYGVPPDVYVDNTPGDFLKGRDAQIEKAVEVLKAELAAKKPTSPNRKPSTSSPKARQRRRRWARAASPGPTRLMNSGSSSSARCFARLRATARW